MSRRQVTGVLGSVAVHALLLVWAMGASPAQSSATTDFVVEPVLVEVAQWTPPIHPLAPEAQSSGEFARETAELPPDPVPPPPVVEPPAPPAEARPRTKASPVAVLTEPEASSPVTVPAAPEGLGESVAPAEPEPEPEPVAPSSGEGDGHAPAATSGAGRGKGHGQGSGDGLADYSAYGAEIVRIVMAEIDGNPVPGISKGESIKIVLKVLPNGRLKRTGLGRWDFARVVATTVGPLRTRSILRRVERASHRFPRHPAGFPRRYYEMDFTVNFTGDRVRLGG